MTCVDSRGRRTTRVDLSTLCGAGHDVELPRGRLAFLARLETKLSEWETKLAPLKAMPLVAYHNSWPYFARRFRLDFVGFLETKPGVPPSPSHLAEILQYCTKHHVKGFHHAHLGTLVETIEDAERLSARDTARCLHPSRDDDRLGEHHYDTIRDDWPVTISSRTAPRPEERAVGERLQ